TDAGGWHAGNGGTRRKRAVGIEEVSRRVDLDMLLVGAASGITTDHQNRAVGKQQRVRVIQPGIRVLPRRAERVGKGIIQVGLEAGGGGVLVVQRAAQSDDLAVR